MSSNGYKQQPVSPAQRPVSTGTTGAAKNIGAVSPAKKYDTASTSAGTKNGSVKAAKFSDLDSEVGPPRKDEKTCEKKPIPTTRTSRLRAERVKESYKNEAPSRAKSMINLASHTTKQNHENCKHAGGVLEEIVTRSEKLSGGKVTQRKPNAVLVCSSKLTELLKSHPNLACHSAVKLLRDVLVILSPDVAVDRLLNIVMHTAMRILLESHVVAPLPDVPPPANRSIFERVLAVFMTLADNVVTGAKERTPTTFLCDEYLSQLLMRLGPPHYMGSRDTDDSNEKLMESTYTLVMKTLYGINQDLEFSRVQDEEVYDFLQLFDVVTATVDQEPPTSAEKATTSAEKATTSAEKTTTSAEKTTTSAEKATTSADVSSASADLEAFNGSIKEMLRKNEAGLTKRLLDTVNSVIFEEPSPPAKLLYVALILSAKIHTVLGHVRKSFKLLNRARIIPIYHSEIMKYEIQSLHAMTLSMDEYGLLGLLHIYNVYRAEPVGRYENKSVLMRWCRPINTEWKLRAVTSACAMAGFMEKNPNTDLILLGRLYRLLLDHNHRKQYDTLQAISEFVCKLENRETYFEEAVIILWRAQAFLVLSLWAEENNGNPSDYYLKFADFIFSHFNRTLELVGPPSSVMWAASVIEINYVLKSLSAMTNRTFKLRAGVLERAETMIVEARGTSWACCLHELFSNPDAAISPDKIVQRFMDENSQKVSAMSTVTCMPHCLRVMIAVQHPGHPQLLKRCIEL